MQALRNYVKEKNTWGAIFNSVALDLNSAEDRKKIADKIDCDLSPENLHCDGEISAAKAHRKYVHLVKIAGQLIKLDPSIRIYEM